MAFFPAKLNSQMWRCVTFAKGIGQGMFAEPHDAPYGACTTLRTAFWPACARPGEGTPAAIVRGLHGCAGGHAADGARRPAGPLPAGPRRRLRLAAPPVLPAGFPLAALSQTHGNCFGPLFCDNYHRHVYPPAIYTTMYATMCTSCHCDF